MLQRSQRSAARDEMITNESKVRFLEARDTPSCLPRSQCPETKFSPLCGHPAQAASDLGSRSWPLHSPKQPS